MVAAIALHLHDTWGMAAANVVAGLEHGIRSFDASAVLIILNGAPATIMLS